MLEGHLGIESKLLWCVASNLDFLSGVCNYVIWIKVGLNMSMPSSQHPISSFPVGSEMDSSDLRLHIIWRILCVWWESGTRAGLHQTASCRVFVLTERERGL